MNVCTYYLICLFQTQTWGKKDFESEFVWQVLKMRTFNPKEKDFKKLVLRTQSKKQHFFFFLMEKQSPNLVI